MKKIYLYLLGAILAIPVLSSAAAAAGYYIGVQGGGAFLPETESSDSDGSFNFSYDAGINGAVAFGYDLGDEHPKIGRGRVEVEVSTASNDLKEAEFVEGEAGVSGSVSRKGIMFNTIGEYNYGSGRIAYVLLGIGWAEVSLDDVSILQTPFVDDSSSEFAYQVGVGIGRRITEHFAADIGYRLYGTTEPEFTTQEGTTLDYEYISHLLVVSLRFYF